MAEPCVRLGGLLAIGLMIALLVAGCSGGSSGSAVGGRSPQASHGTTSTAPQSSSFAARATAICHRMNVEFDAQPPKNGTIAETARITPARAILEKRAADELGRLRVERDQASAWRTLVADRETLAKELAEVGVAARLKRLAAVKRLAESKARLHKRVTAAAERLHIPECAKFGSNS
jgi:hypothetical protein